MSDYQFNNRRPTPLEEHAHAEARTQFAEHLKQFPASQAAVKKLERNLAKLASDMNMAAARPSSLDDGIQTDDGAWHKSTGLFDDTVACHRHTAAGVEYAVVEQFPSGTNEVWAKGYNAIEVLRAFTTEDRRALQIWTEDMAAQVNEHLAEKYPGQDMSRVAEGFMHRFTRPLSFKQTIAKTHQQKHGRRIGI